MSTRQSRRPEKKGKKKNVTLTEKFSMKILFHYPLTFLSANPKIIKAFPKTSPNQYEAY